MHGQQRQAEKACVCAGHGADHGAENHGNEYLVMQAQWRSPWRRAEPAAAAGYNPSEQLADGAFQCRLLLLGKVCCPRQ